MSALAVVTGAGGGLGKAVCEALSAQGIAIIALMRSRDKGSPVPCDQTVIADLAETCDWQALLGPKLRQFEFSHLWLFDIAATLPDAGMRSDSFAQAFDRAMRVNVEAPIAIARVLAAASATCAAPFEIVHVSSGAAHRPIARWGAYCASKAAAAMAWDVLALEEEFVTLHKVQPGVIDTAMQAALRARGDPAAAPRALLREPAAVAADILAQCGIAP
ncbi:SDR family NAD(P)-dependent oxidoreductase [Qipengyuania nanhaisediminis]|uniref:SDR family NAD(P)-dependent oxidoreductase n=1 Tax=Qipengyuania nanhaisediminis TaxID=604088 RepID=UPI0038B35537